MTNYNERLDEILTRLENQVAIDVTRRVLAHKSGQSSKGSHLEAKQAIGELFEEDVEQKQAKIMALVCAENGGEFSISRKTYEEYDDNCVLERLDSPLMDSVVYRLRTTITEKEGV